MSEFEKTLEQLNDFVNLADKLDRLYQVPEFKELILEGYLKKEPERLTEIMGSFTANGLSFGLMTPGQEDRITYAEKLRKDCVRSLEAISNLHTYLKVVFARAEQAKLDIEAYQESLAQGDTE